MLNVPTTCPRCGADLSAGSTTSMFNTEHICLDCKEDEAHCPNYDRARQVESAAVEHGEYNFSGIGLTAQDQAVLQARLYRRRTGTAHA